MRLREHELRGFYEDCYTPGDDGDKYRRWRELGAVTKANHVVNLATVVGVTATATIAEVGCGDGAVLAELGRRGFGQRLIGFEIAASGAQLAAGRAEIDEAHVFDGVRLPVRNGAYDLAFATHVLEHVPVPESLVAEMTRVCRALIIEVPLEANVSARRPAARAASEGAGHLHAFDRGRVRQMVADVGWTVRGEIVDPLPRGVHLFDKTTPAAKAKGYAKWAIRAGLGTVPGVAARIFTLHYALVATR